jgi:hypothetical protein
VRTASRVYKDQDASTVRDHKLRRFTINIAKRRAVNGRDTAVYTVVGTLGVVVWLDALGSDFN